MPDYRYTLHKDATLTEALGFIDLCDDAEAVAFGERVARDMKHWDPADYAGCSLQIMQDERPAGEVLFDAIHAGN
jgi:hypothetical protein